MAPVVTSNTRRRKYHHHHKNNVLPSVCLLLLLVTSYTSGFGISLPPKSSSSSSSSSSIVGGSTTTSSTIPRFYQPQHHERGNNNNNNNDNDNVVITTNTKEKTLYEILGARETATKVELKRCYVRLAKATHPDARIGMTYNNNDNNLAQNDGTPTFSEVAAAWKVLGDAKSRKRYDGELRAKEFSEQVQKVTDENLEKAFSVTANMIDKTAQVLGNFFASKKKELEVTPEPVKATKTAPPPPPPPRRVLEVPQSSSNLRGFSPKVEPKPNNADVAKEPIVAMPSKMAGTPQPSQPKRDVEELKSRVIHAAVVKSPKNNQEPVIVAPSPTNAQSLTNKQKIQPPQKPKQPAQPVVVAEATVPKTAATTTASTTTRTTTARSINPDADNNKAAKVPKSPVTNGRVLQPNAAKMSTPTTFSKENNDNTNKTPPAEQQPVASTNYVPHNYYIAKDKTKTNDVTKKRQTTTPDSRTPVVVNNVNKDVLPSMGQMNKQKKAIEPQPIKAPNLQQRFRAGLQDFLKHSTPFSTPDLFAQSNRGAGFDQTLGGDVNYYNEDDEEDTDSYYYYEQYDANDDEPIVFAKVERHEAILDMAQKLLQQTEERSERWKRTNQALAALKRERMLSDNNYKAAMGLNGDQQQSQQHQQQQQNYRNGGDDNRTNNHFYYYAYDKKAAESGSFENEETNNNNNNNIILDPDRFAVAQDLINKQIISLEVTKQALSSENLSQVASHDELDELVRDSQESLRIDQELDMADEFVDEIKGVISDQLQLQVDRPLKGRARATSRDAIHPIGFFGNDDDYDDDYQYFGGGGGGRNDDYYDDGYYYDSGGYHYHDSGRPRF